LVSTYISFKGYVAVQKLNSPQLVGPGFNTSLGSQPIKAMQGNITYALFRMNGYYSDVFGINKGDKGAIVIPEVFLNEMNGHFSFNSIPDYVGLKHLPLFFQEYIKENQIKPPYIYAVVPKDLDLITMPEDFLVDYAPVLKAQNSL